MKTVHCLAALMALAISAPAMPRCPNGTIPPNCRLPDPPYRIAIPDAPCPSGTVPTLSPNECQVVGQPTSINPRSDNCVAVAKDNKNKRFREESAANADSEALWACNKAGGKHCRIVYSYCPPASQ